MKTRLEPFRLAEGRLLLEDVELAEVAEGLRGCPAWVIGGLAVQAALSRALQSARGGPVSVAIGAIGPVEVLALAAGAGCWARIASVHELELARRAGFPPERMAVDAPVLDDGLIVAALTAGVAVLVRNGTEETRGVARIASGLRLGQPPATGAPPPLPAATWRGCGGLLARLHAGPPALALDAVWEPESLPKGVLPVVVAVADASGGISRMTVRGLASTRGRPAEVIGRPLRGDWVLIPSDEALAVRPPHPARPMPRSVLVQQGRWRELEARPLPPVE